MPNAFGKNDFNKHDRHDRDFDDDDDDRLLEMMSQHHDYDKQDRHDRNFDADEDYYVLEMLRRRRNKPFGGTDLEGFVIILICALILLIAVSIYLSSSGIL